MFVAQIDSYEPVGGGEDVGSRSVDHDGLAEGVSAVGVELLHYRDIIIHRCRRARTGEEGVDVAIAVHQIEIATAQGIGHVGRYAVLAPQLLASGIDLIEIGTVESTGL